MNICKYSIHFGGIVNIIAQTFSNFILNDNNFSLFAYMCVCVPEVSIGPRPEILTAPRMIWEYEELFGISNIFGTDLWMYIGSGAWKKYIQARRDLVFGSF